MDELVEGIVTDVNTACILNAFAANSFDDNSNNTNIINDENKLYQWM